MRAVAVIVLAVAVTIATYAGGTGEYGEPLDMITIHAGDYSFRAHTAGDPQDPPVILLHGFPETSFMWRSLQAVLAERGYYSIAFDQRGYSPDARPRGRGRYTLDLVAGDVISVAESLGIERFHLIGHDWGSAAGWAVAATYPRRVLSWTALSVPHVDALARAIRDDQAQYEASAYMRLFQFPLVPELLLKSRDFRRLKAIWQDSSPEEVEAYLSVFSEPGAVSAALNWYRANYRSLTGQERILPNVEVPTLFVWGRNDPAILQTGPELNSEYVSGPYTEHFLDAGHWLVQEAFPELSELILDHLVVTRNSVR